MTRTTKRALAGSFLTICLTLLVARGADATLAISVVPVDDFGNPTAPAFLVSDGDSADDAGPLATEDEVLTITELIDGMTLTVAATTTPRTGIDPELQLVNLSIGGPTVGRMRITATDTDYLTTPTSNVEFTSSIAGMTTGTVTAKSFIDSGNTAFATNTPIHDFGLLDSPAFSGSSTFSVASLFSPFSMTLVLEIDHQHATDVTAFTFATSTSNPSGLASVPEPSALFLGLAGAALACLFRVRRPKKRRQQ